MGSPTWELPQNFALFVEDPLAIFLISFKINLMIRQNFIWFDITRNSFQSFCVGRLLYNVGDIGQELNDGEGWVARELGDMLGKH